MLGVFLAHLNDVAVIRYQALDENGKPLRDRDGNDLPGETVEWPCHASTKAESVGVQTADGVLYKSRPFLDLIGDLLPRPPKPGDRITLDGQVDRELLDGVDNAEELMGPWGPEALNIRIGL